MPNTNEITITEQVITSGYLSGLINHIFDLLEFHPQESQLRLDITETLSLAVSLQNYLLRIALGAEPDNRATVKTQIKDELNRVIKIFSRYPSLPEIHDIHFCIGKIFHTWGIEIQTSPTIIEEFFGRTHAPI